MVGVVCVRKIPIKKTKGSPQGGFFVLSLGEDLKTLLSQEGFSNAPDGSCKVDVTCGY
jgi:hypothetical protein